jgi:hypothetical protein
MEIFRRDGGIVEVGQRQLFCWKGGGAGVSERRAAGDLLEEIQILDSYERWKSLKGGGRAAGGGGRGLWAVGCGHCPL